MKIKIEACTDSVFACTEAEKGGAIRVELCDNLFEGGTTPSIGMIRRARAKIKIGLHVLIRPRGGDFYYSDDEFEVMKADIEAAKEAGADGVVLGLLNRDGEIELNRTAELIEQARPMSVTFHRAFDMAADPFRALDDLINLGADRLLTSGQEQSAFEGAELIAELVKKAGKNLVIMPGGGISDRNIAKIVRATGVTECHMSGRSRRESDMIFRKSGVFMGGSLRPSEFTLAATDSARISAAISAGEGLV